MQNVYIYTMPNASKMPFWYTIRGNAHNEVMRLGPKMKDEGERREEKGSNEATSEGLTSKGLKTVWDEMDRKEENEKENLKWCH